jgi:hypothetical protein
VETVLEDRFLVYLRPSRGPAERPQPAERLVVVCSTYEEARQFRRDCQGAARDCVIRYIGPSGGGD